MISIPNYTIKEKIGEGGMAEVYRATHKILKHSVAVKVMSAALMKDKSFKKSFITEGQIMKKLKHPHIVEIYDIGVSHDFCYMIIELLEKESLKDKLAKAPLPVVETLRIIEQISAALRFAHDQGYIHRDIKPANILFRDNGDAILTDFGISKLQGTSGDLTQMGYLIGSPYYMSPEQIQGTALDKRSDIYNLGIVFYEMLTGEKPFSGDTTVAISYEHIHADIPTLDNPFRLFQPVLNKVLQKDRSKRYTEITEFADTLFEATEEKEREDETQIVQPIPSTPLPQKGIQTKTPLSLILGLSAVIIGGVITYFILQDSSQIEEDTITVSDPVKEPIDPLPPQPPKEPVDNPPPQPPKEPITNNPTQPPEDNTPMISLLLDKSLSNLSSAITTYIRIQKEQQSIEKLKSLPAESSRTKFITARKIAIIDLEKAQLNNQNKYCSSIIKLGQYPIIAIEKQLTRTQNTLIIQYTKPAYRDLKQFLLAHITPEKTVTLTDKKCSADIIKTAKQFSQHY